MAQYLKLSFLFVLCSSPLLCEAVLTGFPKERCDDMDPTLVPIEHSTSKEDAQDVSNSSDYSEDTIPTSLQASTRHSLFRIVTSPKYRRGRVMDITIRGPEFNAFMLQVRKIGPDERRGYDKPARVGEFESWPSTLQPVMCDAGKATALTSKNYLSKNGITVKWRAPKENVGDIHVVGRFVYGDEYWPLTESREIPLNEFPVNLAKCGKAKSCVLYSESSDSCHEDNCDYILTYSVVNNSVVEFVLGGSAKNENTFMGVGFSKNSDGMKMNMIACTRAKTVAEIKHFVVPTVEEGPMEHAMTLENQKMDLDGDRMWCSFTLPLSGHHTGDDGDLDLSVPLYQVYLRGKTNNTKSVNMPILPSKLLVSKNEVQIEKIKVQYHTMEKLKSTAAASLHINAFSVVLFSLLMFTRF